MYSDNQEENDYFDTVDPPVPEKKPKPVALREDDPRYWERESRWDHLRPSRRSRFYMWLVGAAVVIGLIVAVWLRYFNPCVEGAVQYGYVENIENRGSVFKTPEGVLIPYKDIMDTTRLYTRDFIFTAADMDVATRLKRMQLARIPVVVEYKRYYGTLPWRGASQIIVTKVDTADPRKILPPEFTPEVHRDR